jgi:hypothetical protein
VRTRLGRAVAALTAVAVTSVAIVGGCSSDGTDDPPDDAASPSTSSESPEKPSVTTAVVLGRVVGKLDAKRKQSLKDDLKEVVDGFFDAAYLGDFPRDSFAKAYAAFSSGAREDAARDAALLSNAEIADRIETATGVKRRVALDVLAVQGTPRGVTARFTLDFDTTGELERRERVKGYLLLTREDGQWQVFGYDVIRSVIA